MNYMFFYLAAILLLGMPRLAGAAPIAELYLFPRERLSTNTLDAYQEVMTNSAWAKFDKVGVYGALPNNPPYFKIFMQAFQHLAQLHGRDLAYQAPTIGAEGWEQYSWSRSDFWEQYGPKIPSTFWGLDIESLRLKPTVPSADRALKIRTFLDRFIRAANASKVQKDVWFTGSWDHFQPSGKAAPLIFTPDLVAQLDRVHWMDLPKLLSTYGDEAAYRKQIKMLLEITGPQKTYLQVGFLNDMDMAGNAARARRMMAIAQQIGINRFTIYVKLSEMHDPKFKEFYDELQK